MDSSINAKPANLNNIFVRVQLVRDLLVDCLHKTFVNTQKRVQNQFVCVGLWQFRVRSRCWGCVSAFVRVVDRFWWHRGQFYANSIFHTMIFVYFLNENVRFPISQGWKTMLRATIYCFGDRSTFGLFYYFVF